MVTLLISALVILVLLLILREVLGMLSLSPGLQRIILLIVALIALIWLLGQMGLYR